ncbi:MAG: hypothetical protein O3B00_04780 [archaeon]|nr:hypothetical protein [archaeon]
MTDDEENENEGTGLEFDNQYKKLYDDLAKKHFKNKISAAVFALSLGIAKNWRVPRDEWKNPKLREDGTRRPHHFGTVQQVTDGFGDFGIVFDALGLKKEGHNTKMTIDEFVTGGLKFIKDHGLIEDGNLMELKTEMPNLFSNNAV